MRLCAALALLLASQGLWAQQTLPPRLEDLFTQGVQAQKAGRLEEAEKAFLEVLREGGKLSFVYNNLGAVYQQRREHQRAVRQLREAVRLQPDYAAPRILMGASLLVLGEIPEATRQLEQGVKLQPKEPLARWQLAKAYERGGNFPGMVEQFRVLCELEPQNSEYAYQLGRAYQKLAGWCFQQIARLNPSSARVYQALGESYHAQGHTDFAIRAYQRAAHADARLPGIHLALAQIYLEQGKQAEARQEIEQELAIVPESVVALALKQRLESTSPQSQP
jgi:tetratricopeptide (TPR) repeat protein